MKIRTLVGLGEMLYAERLCLLWNGGTCFIELFRIFQEQITTSKGCIGVGKAVSLHGTQHFGNFRDSQKRRIFEQFDYSPNS